MSTATLAFDSHRRLTSRRWPLIALAVIIASGLAVWLISQGTGGPSGPATPTAADAGQLRSLSASVGHPIYWAGKPASGNQLELTQAADGSIFVRYLRGGAELGDGRDAFTTVGTYPVPSAFAVLGREAKRSTAITRSLPGGGIAFMDVRRPRSVYLAWPDSAYEVEVFDPSPKRALDLVLDGAVVPVR